MIHLERLFGEPGRALIGGVPEGFDALLLNRVRRLLPDRDIVFVARDEARMMRLAELLDFFGEGEAPAIFPAWDCLPYDRVSPNPSVVSRRVAALAALADEGRGRGLTVLTTVAAVLQRIPEARAIAGLRFAVRAGARLDLGALTAFLARAGYVRSGTVTDPGEYALRGGLVDLFPAGAAMPVRVDLLGEEVESIHAFDPATQRSAEAVAAVDVMAMSEAILDEASIARFRAGYVELFGAMTGGDPLYESISAGRRHAGMEHWLPLLHERMASFLDALPGATVVLDHQMEALRDARIALIEEHYAARLEAPSGPLLADLPPYRPLPPDRLYLGVDDWRRALAGRPVVELSPFVEAAGEESGWTAVVDAGGRGARDFGAARRSADLNLLDAVKDTLAAERATGRRAVVAGVTPGSRDRLATLLADHGVGSLAKAETWREVQALESGTIALVTLGLDHGFETADLVVLSEQDIFGDRLVRPSRRQRRADALLAEASRLAEGDLVVHVDHGIGRYEGLQTLTLGNAPHDCLRVVYDGGDRLFVPVENIEVLSRFGPADGEVALDKLGAASWQARKARLKKRVTDMAGALLKVAAERRLRPGRVFEPPPGAYEEFCARFPYVETDDQARAIADVTADLAAGTPMDRLICGDVGFGKTEVALRAAFVVALNGAQVAVVVPTTLLARQHLETFRDRFAGLPVRIGQLSRLVGAKEAKAVKEGLRDGQVDIVIGTHALLAADVVFKDLGLLIVDEEQHFGVRHKEALKRLRASVHVLTLTATPIPRTLQMALTGVREMSVIATPPVDRLAVRTYITPFDPVVVREALQRERYRGGQIYYVCPRIADLDDVAAKVRAMLPEIRLATAHSRLAARRLEETMAAFYDGALDVLVSTAIVESGLDIPTVNTLVVHRADLFGLAQLYQLRGRIGRAKLRAYAYLTLPHKGTLGHAAEQRLAVMQKLDSLGAGFSLASHDLDIRGAGNLLGEEQSGHIREVGIELYQQLLQEAIESLRATEAGAPAPAGEWSPQINLGTAVLIPEEYVSDLDLRLGLYRRVADLRDKHEIDALAVELADRFGPLPDAVNHLLDVIAIKQLCRAAGIARYDAGEGGAIVAFRGDSFPNPEGLVAFIAAQAGTMRLRPDHRLVAVRAWGEVKDRVRESQRLLAELAAIAGARAPAAVAD
jgi:transcription-repair coupling factor (superfamily II helicase)